MHVCSVYAMQHVHVCTISSVQISYQHLHTHTIKIWHAMHRLCSFNPTSSFSLVVWSVLRKILYRFIAIGVYRIKNKSLNVLCALHTVFNANTIKWWKEEKNQRSKLRYKKLFGTILYTVNYVVLFEQGKLLWNYVTIQKSEFHWKQNQKKKPTKEHQQFIHTIYF